MSSLAANALRLFLAILLGVASTPVTFATDCGAKAARRVCVCCPPSGGGCCAAAENQTPRLPAPSVDTKSQQTLRDAITPLPPLVLLLPSADAISFPMPHSLPLFGVTGHSRQSLLCVRNV
jgi:hypothetical protein